MELKGFKKMSQEKRETTYGGWAWLVAMVPLLLQSIVTTTASIKSIFSEKGTIKSKDIQATWDNKEAAPKGSSSSKVESHVSYYAY